LQKAANLRTFSNRQSSALIQCLVGGGELEAAWEREAVDAEDASSRFNVFTFAIKGDPENAAGHGVLVPMYCYPGRDRITKHSQQPNRGSKIPGHACKL